MATSGRYSNEASFKELAALCNGAFFSVLHPDLDLERGAFSSKDRGGWQFTNEFPSHLTASSEEFVLV